MFLDGTLSLHVQEPTTVGYAVNILDHGFWGMERKL
jgi:hypothetical protein